MEGKQTYKAQRSSGKALLKQLIPELNFFNKSLTRAETLIILGEAEETVRDYKSAAQDYATAIQILEYIGAGIEIGAREKVQHQAIRTDETLETLADTVEQRVERASEGLRSVEAKIRLEEYVNVKTQS